MRFKEFLIESEYNRKPLHWLDKQTKSALISASNKIKQLVDATGDLRVGVSDDEDGQHDFGYYLKKYDGGDRNRGQFYVTIHGKYIPLDNEMRLTDLIDRDDETGRKIRDKIEKRRGKKELTAKDVERMWDKSLKMMQSLIRTLDTTKFPVWTDDEGIEKTVVLDHVEWYDHISAQNYVRVSPEAAVLNLARVYPRNERFIQDFGRELYAPHVELYFKIKAL